MALSFITGKCQAAGLLERPVEILEQRCRKLLGKKNGVEEAVAALTAPNDTPEQKVQKIYSFVTQLENTSYVPFRPEQERKVLGIKRNQGVEDVLQQRSGDHYDLNRLFVSMARAVGVPAWMILLPDREYKIFVPSCSV